MAAREGNAKIEIALVLVLAGAAVAGGLALAGTFDRPDASCGAAVAVWLRDGHLPLPRLSAGPKDLVIQAGGFNEGASPADTDGCTRIQVYRRTDRDRLVAEYDVAWFGDPATFRLAAAHDRLTGHTLVVRDVPDLAEADLAGTEARGTVTWNPFD